MVTHHALLVALGIIGGTLIGMWVSYYQKNFNERRTQQSKCVAISETA